MHEPGRLRLFFEGFAGAVLGFLFGGCTVFPAAFLLGRLAENALGWSSAPILGDPGVSPLGGLFGFVAWIAAIWLGAAVAVRHLRADAARWERKARESPDGWDGRDER